MKLGKELGFGRGDILLHGDPDPSPQRGTAPLIFGPCLLWPNSSTDQDVTW